MSQRKSKFDSLIEDLRNSVESCLTMVHWQVAPSNASEDVIGPVIRKITSVQHIFSATTSELPPDALVGLINGCRTGRAILVIDATAQSKNVLSRISTPFMIQLVAVALRKGTALPIEDGDQISLCLGVAQLASIAYRWQVVVIVSPFELIVQQNSGEIEPGDQLLTTQVSKHLTVRDVEQRAIQQREGSSATEVMVVQTGEKAYLDKAGISYTRESAVDLFGFRVHEFTDTEKLTAAIGVLIGLLCRGAQRLPSPLSQRQSLLHSDSWGHGLSLPLEEDVVHLWRFEDFEFEDARDCFGLIVGSFGKLSQKDSHATRLQRERVFLNVLSLARRFATRAFEGRPCITNLMLVSKDLQESRGEKSDCHFTPNGAIVFEYGTETIVDSFNDISVNQRDKSLDESQDKLRRCPPAFCNFADFEFVHDDIELAQSEEMFFIIDANDGKVLRIEASQQLYRDTGITESRYDRLVSLTREGKDFVRECIVIALRPEGFVEVYFSGKLVLWHDRFRWRSEPFRRLELLLNDYRNHKLSKELHRGDNVEKRYELSFRSILGAIGQLMDGWHSSILVFCSREEMRELEEKTHSGEPGLLERLRSDRPRLPSSGLPMSDVPLDALVAILRLDGAHFFDGDHLFGLSRRVNVRQSNRSGGTGRAAAVALAEKIAPPGFVLKVSASGELKILVGTNKP